MARFNLNEQADFVKATLGDAAGVLQQFIGPPEKWDIQEGSYNGIVFHVLDSPVRWNGSLGQVQDQGGRRLVTYAFPYQDGQTTDDLGRKGQTYNLLITLHGNRYLEGYRKLMQELQKPEPGDFIHPVIGLLTCKMQDYTILHESQTRKALVLNLTLVEHNFTLNDFDTLAEDFSAKSAIADALQVFEDIEALVLKVQGAVVFLQGVKNSITSLINNFKANYATLLAKMNGTFNKGSSGGGGARQDIPGLVPVNQGGVLLPDGTRSSSTFPTVASPNDPFQSAPTTTLAQQTVAAIAVEELQKEVNVLREQVNALIAQLSQTEESALEFNQEVIDLKVAAVRLQDILEKGRKSSKAVLVSYTTPRLMTIREVAFENSIPINRVNEIELLNPDLESVNYIPKGSVLRVAR